MFDRVLGLRRGREIAYVGESWSRQRRFFVNGTGIGAEVWWLR